jgi:hypothetical protein
MNVEIVTDASSFFFWEYLFPIFGIVSMQCIAVYPLQTRISVQLKKLISGRGSFKGTVSRFFGYRFFRESSHPGP